MISKYLEAVQELRSRVDGRDPELRLPPHSFVDADGRVIRFRAYDGDAFEPLVSMYTDFDSARRAQGTPPVGESAIRNWLETVLAGVSVVAWHDDRIVGHVLFVPAESGHELAVFVHQDFHRAGIGSALLRTGLGFARSRGIADVWLTVEARKEWLHRLYGEAGFTTDVYDGVVYRMSRTV